MPDSHTTAPLRALFIEDNADLRDIIGMLLEEEGLQVHTCASAEEAELAFAPDRFDLVITDVSLPGISGTELARRLLQRAPAIWIVFSSGYAFDRGLESWGPRVRSLSKPFEVEALQTLLDEIRASRP